MPSPLKTWLGRAWRLLAGGEQRKTVVLPAVHRGIARQALPKPTPLALRRFSETPVARKAINSIKDRVAAMHWRVQIKGANAAEQVRDPRIALLTANLESPNADDSFRSLTEQVIEDVLVCGAGAIEAQLTFLGIFKAFTERSHYGSQYSRAGAHGESRRGEKSAEEIEAPRHAADNYRHYIVSPVAGTVESVCVMTFVAGTLGSAHNVTFVLRKNKSTDSAESGTQQWTATDNAAVCWTLTTAFTVAAGDALTLKFTTPTWTTTPTQVQIRWAARILQNQ